MENSFHTLKQLIFILVVIKMLDINIDKVAFTYEK